MAETRHEHGDEAEKREMVGVDPPRHTLCQPDQRLLLDRREHAELFAFRVPKRLSSHEITIAPNPPRWHKLAAAIQTVGALQGYVRAGNGLAGVSRLAMSDRWSLGQEGGVHRGNAAVKNARQGTWHHWDAWSVPLRKEATTRGMLGAESSCSRLQPANRKPDAHDQYQPRALYGGLAFCNR